MIQIGGVRVDALYDLPLDVDRERIFPDVPEAEWSSVNECLTPEGKVRLEVVSYLIRTEGRTILCDTGMRRSPGDETGRLLESLGEIGVAPDQVDQVVFTHLHGDHIGWNVEWTGEEARPVFARAEYIIQQAEWEHFVMTERRETPSVQRQLLPLERLGNLRLIAGACDLTDEVRLVPTGGHTPGHMSLEIASGGERAFIQGDIAVHHVLLLRPDWTPRFDFDPPVARTLRDEVLDRWAQEGLLIVANHFPYPGYGYVAKSPGGWEWRPLE
jgi:glyoxylase-like metal-dependent hydrolase (beta-lactamase superfamily II)